MQRERRLVAEYVVERFPKSRVIFDCPLGPVPEKMVATLGYRKALRLARGLRPMVDALVIQDHEVILIEAKILKWLDGMAKLPIYRGLVKSTPELQEYKNYSSSMVLCTPWISETIEAAAGIQEVKVDIFCPEWINDYLTELGKYWSRDYQKARAEKKRLREIFGVE